LATANGADGESRAQRLLACRGSARHGDYFGHNAGFLEPHRLFDGDFVEGIHRHFDVGRLDAATVGLDADLDVVVDDALDGNQNFHCHSG